ncbi:unnamed protein product [Cylindrotheca closterium]|uniref:Uncharacterized protein n=1 Tax=Cylindrotheca closterium TaxID=2856 RepID=A0AAD2FBV6_9STRA|nr:unnamed protein product [Cylindrotheca closterium]
MDARLLIKSKSGQMKQSRSLVVLNSKALEPHHSSPNAKWERDDDSNVYHRHRSKVKQNMQTSLNAALKSEDPKLYSWVTNPMQQAGRNRSKERRNKTSSGDRKNSVRSPGARRLRKVFSFNSKQKASKRDSSSNDLTSSTWHGDGSPTTSKHSGHGGARRMLKGKSKSFRQDPNASRFTLEEQNVCRESSLNIPLHLKAVCKQPARSSPRTVQRSTSARISKSKNSAPTSPTLQRSTSARVSSPTTTKVPSEQLPSQLSPKLKRSTSARMPSSNGPTSPTLERARSARLSRRGRRRSIHDDHGEGIFNDINREKGYIASFLGSSDHSSQQSNFEHSNGMLV